MDNHHYSHCSLAEIIFFNVLVEICFNFYLEQYFNMCILTNKMYYLISLHQSFSSNILKTLRQISQNYIDWTFIILALDASYVEAEAAIATFWRNWVTNRLLLFFNSISIDLTSQIGKCCEIVVFLMVKN